MNCNDGETESMLAKQLRKRKLSILLFLGIMCSCFILAHVAVTWVVRVERAHTEQGFGSKLFLVEIVDGNYVFVWGHTPYSENIYVSLNDLNRIFVRFLDEPVVRRSYDVYYCYNFFGGIVGLALTYSN